MTDALPLPPEYLAMLNGSLDPLGIVGRDGIYVWVNDAGARFFGYAREEVVGRHFREHLRDDEEPGDAMRRAQDGGAAAVVRRVRRKDGSVAVLRTELIPLASGHVLIHATDLTTLYATLDRITESERGYRQLLEAVRVPMLIWTRPDGATPSVIRYANAPLAELLGTPLSDLTGSSTTRWTAPEELAEVVTYIDRVVAGETPGPLGLGVRRADGRPRASLLVAGPVVFEGRPAVCGQIIDISEQERLREQAARARETDLAIAVAAGVAHDFNNILTGVLGYLDFAALEVPEDSPAVPHLLAAQLAARRAANLAQALLGYSRSSAKGEAPGEERARVVDVTDLVREAFAITRAAIARTVTMVTHEGEERAYAAIPPDSLLRVLVNLLVNARDAVLEQRERSGPEYRPTIDLSVDANPADATVDIRVTDNGVGIPPAVAQRVFDPYFTTKGERGGSGIGLSAARELARAVGGELSFTSAPGEGTSFLLRLPRVVPPEGAEASV